MAKLAAGYNIVIKQNVSGVNTPLYPLTAVENVFDKDGTSLASILSTITGDFSNYILSSEKGVASGVATLDENGFVPSSQLPSYVDDVLDGYLYDGAFYKEVGHTTVIPAAGGKIYVDIPSKKTYRYAGSEAGYVEISESIVIGTTAGTAYDGAAGAALATKLAGISEGATKTEASSNNGYIKIDDVETLVFTPATASSSGAGYMSASDFNKLAAISAGANKVEASTTNGNIKIDNVDTTVFTPDVVSSSQNGYMTSAQNDKLAGCEEIAVSATASAPTFSSGSGLWFEKVSAYTPNPDPEP